MYFLIISVIIFNAVALWVHKRLRKCELYAVFWFSIVLGFTIDVTLDLKYHLYGYFQPGVQFMGFLPILGLFPSAGILYMNFFPYKKSVLKKLTYTIAWSIFCLAFEYLSIQSGYFYHNGWKYWHSSLTYPLLFYIHLLHLKGFRRYLE